jgi:hypothetical protein
MKFCCIALLGGWVLFFSGFSDICALAEPVTFDPPPVGDFEPFKHDSLSLDRHNVNPDPFGPVAERHPWETTDQDLTPLLLTGPTPEAILRTLDLPLDEIKDAQKQEELSHVNESEAVKTEWLAWNKRFSESLTMRFSKLSGAAFGRSRSIVALVRYEIRNCRIRDVTVVRKSWNPLFNTLVQGILNSFNDDSLLQFPAGSKIEKVVKFTLFSQNFDPEGFSPGCEWVRSGGKKPILLSDPTEGKKDP